MGGLTIYIYIYYTRLYSIYIQCHFHQISGLFWHIPKGLLQEAEASEPFPTATVKAGDFEAEAGQAKGGSQGKRPAASSCLLFSGEGGGAGGGGVEEQEQEQEDEEWRSRRRRSPEEEWRSRRRRSPEEEWRSRRRGGEGGLVDRCL